MFIMNAALHGVTTHLSQLSFAWTVYLANEMHTVLYNSKLQNSWETSYTNILTLVLIIV